MKHSVFFILLTLITMSVFGQNITITGTVTDEKGNPMAGAIITEKGVTNSTLSDAGGHYQISVKNNPVLVFEMKGYQTREFKVNDVNAPIWVVLTKKRYKYEFGLIAGGNMSFGSYFGFHDDVPVYSNYWTGLSGEYHFQPFGGYNAGFYFDNNICKVFTVEAIVSYDSRGIKEKDGNYTGITRFYNVSVPILFKFKINIHDNYLFPFIGGAGNFFINGRAEETFGSNKRSWDLESMGPISADVIAGIGFESKFGLGVRVNFNYGMGYCGDNDFSVYMMQASLSYRLFGKRSDYLERGRRKK